MTTEPDVTRIEAGPFLTNTYLLKSGKEAIIVDPGAEASLYLGAFRLQDVKVKAVIATHGHMDHLFDIADLKKSLGCSFHMGRDEQVLKWSYSVSEKYMGRALQNVEIDQTLKEGDTVLFGDVKAEILDLPGHTPGSIGILAGSVFLTGDTLFKGTIGRTDLGGSMEQMNETLLRIKGMDQGLRVLPGHGHETTIAEEIRSNSFLE